MSKENHKPIIETLINTAAIAISAVGVIQIQKGDFKGLVLVLFATGLEFLKYWGRKFNYW